MGKEEHEQGKKTEEVIHKICEKMFLPDFVVRNPLFQRRSGIKREMADTLVLFKDHLLGFQVRSKKELKKASEKNETDAKRIDRRIEGAIKQLNEIEVALEANEIVKVKNSRDIEFELKSDSVKKVIGIIVLDLLGEEEFPEEERSEILGGYSTLRHIPVHIFMRSDLELIAAELDTLPDFLTYLDAREQLYSRQILLPYVSERDFLALYKMRSDIIQSALNGEPDVLVVSEGHWESYINNELVKQRNENNKPSYLIDRIIEEFHTSIGFKGPQGLELRNDVTPGTSQSYFITVSELASLTRMERRACGEKILPCLKRADQKPYAHSLFLIPEKKKGVLIFSSSNPREQRCAALQSLAGMAYCTFELNEVIGIATENYSVTSRSYDFALLKDVFFKNADELKRNGKKIFGNGKPVRYAEYGNNRVVNSTKDIKKTKIGRNDSCPCGSEKKYKKCCL